MKRKCYSPAKIGRKIFGADKHNHGHGHHHHKKRLKTLLVNTRPQIFSDE
jgi:hypothetical protein